MRIFLPSFLFNLKVFLLCRLSRLLQTKLYYNCGKYNDLLVIIYDMCNAHKKTLLELSYSNKTIRHNAFYKIADSSG
jgi:hypothetical protein